MASETTMCQKNKSQHHFRAVKNQVFCALKGCLKCFLFTDPEDYWGLDQFTDQVSLQLLVRQNKVNAKKSQPLINKSFSLTLVQDKNLVRYSLSQMGPDWKFHHLCIQIFALIIMVSSVLELIQVWLVRPQHMACTLRIRGDDRENSAREKFVRQKEKNNV